MSNDLVLSSSALANLTEFNDNVGEKALDSSVERVQNLSALQPKRATVKPIKPEPKAKVKEKNSLRRRAAAEGSSRKTYTATLTARRRVACGLNIKLPKEKIEDIDAVYNELAVVEYAEDIYKFYKEAEDPAKADKLLKIQRELDETKFFLVGNVL
nr:G2/mitotic-specific cyclin S13-7-like isoform X1 [Ipomoea batatas]